MKPLEGAAELINRKSCDGEWTFFPFNVPLQYEIASCGRRHIHVHFHLRDLKEAARRTARLMQSNVVW